MAADRQLWLSKTDKQKSLERHLPWGSPRAQEPVGNEILLSQRDYLIKYDRDLLVPIWTAHRLDGKTLGKVERVDCFRRDPRIDAPGASLPNDYKEPIYDQGHLTPNGDMSKGLTPVVNSFVLSNMAPQFCQFNRGVWQIFESLVRLWAKEKRTLYVITGSVFDRDADGNRDPNSVAKRMKSKNGAARVAIPSHFYKILVHQRSDGAVETLAVSLPHNQTDLDGDPAFKYLEKHIRSIEELEIVTGLTFFPNLPASAANVKKIRTQELWSHEGKPARSLVDDRCRATAGANG